MDDLIKDLRILDSEIEREEEKDKNIQNKQLTYDKKQKINIQKNDAHSNEKFENYKEISILESNHHNYLEFINFAYLSNFIHQNIFIMQINTILNKYNLL